jgi:hypothetical protein
LSDLYHYVYAISTPPPKPNTIFLYAAYDMLVVLVILLALEAIVAATNSVAVNILRLAFLVITLQRYSNL